MGVLNICVIIAASFFEKTLQSIDPFGRGVRWNYAISHYTTCRHKPRLGRTSLTFIIKIFAIAFRYILQGFANTLITFTVSSSIVLVAAFTRGGLS